MSTIDEHRRLVRRLRKNPSDIAMSLTPEHADMLHMSVGLAGEAGEVVDLIKKHVINGHPINRRELAEELGDVLFYLHGLCMHTDLSMDEILQGNIDKLNARYAEGRYTDHQSRARADKAGAA